MTEAVRPEAETYIVAVEVSGTAYVQVTSVDTASAVRWAVDNVRQRVVPDPLPVGAIQLSDVYVLGGGVVDPADYEGWAE